MYYIYMISNLITNVCYIGYSKNPYARWSKHKWLYRQKFDRYLYNSMNKYKIENFTFEVIEAYDTFEKVLCAEKYWIKYMKDFGIELYNLTDGGEGTVGWKPTVETCQKIADSKKNISMETRQKLSRAQTGKKASPETIIKMKNRVPTQETRAKLSKAKSGDNNYMYGKTHSEEARLLISRSHSGENSYRAKLTFDIANQIREEYSDTDISMPKLAKKYNVTSNSIWRIIHNLGYVRK